MGVGLLHCPATIQSSTLTPTPTPNPIGEFYVTLTTTTHLTITWLSRHTPTQSQRAELSRLFPNHKLLIDKRSFGSAKDIANRFRASGAAELVVVAPLSMIRELIKCGIHPIWAEMQQVACHDSAVEVSNNGRCYKFIKFHRITDVRLELTELVPPPSLDGAGPTL